MKAEFVDYLETIGVSKRFIEKINGIYNIYKKLCTDKIAEIFVTDYMNEDGKREFENLFFFSKQYIMEAKQFAIRDEYDLMPIRNNIDRWELQIENYDFVKATSASRFNLKLNFRYGLSANFKASGENCDCLKDILVKYIRPNMRIPL